MLRMYKTLTFDILYFSLEGFNRDTVTILFSLILCIIIPKQVEIRTIYFQQIIHQTKKKKICIGQW